MSRSTTWFAFRNNTLNEILVTKYENRKTHLWALFHLQYRFWHHNTKKSTRDFIQKQLIHSLSNSYTSSNIFGVPVLMLSNATMISSFNCSACQGIKRSDKLPAVIKCMSPIKLISIQLSHSFRTTLCIKIFHANQQYQKKIFRITKYHSCLESHMKWHYEARAS
jgi:hypothetical protein